MDFMMDFIWFHEKKRIDKSYILCYFLGCLNDFRWSFWWTSMDLIDGVWPGDFSDFDCQFHGWLWMVFIDVFMGFWHMAVCQNLVPLVNIKIAGKWMFIPLKMVLIGIDPYPYFDCFFDGFTPSWPRPRSGRAGQRFRRLSGDQGHRGVTVWLPQGLDGFRGFFFPNKMTIPSINGMNFMGFHGISWDFHGISWDFMRFPHWFRRHGDPLGSPCRHHRFLKTRFQVDWTGWWDDLGNTTCNHH